MSPFEDEALLLYKIIFQGELYALIKSREHDGIPLSSSERKTIRNNNESMAEYAARHYIEDYGINLDDENAVQEAIDKTIKATLRHFR